MPPPLCEQSITITLDTSKAFNTINIHTLIRKLLQTKSSGTIMKFIANYITSYPLHKHTIYFQHSKAQKPTIFNNGRYTTIIPTDPHTFTTTDITTNMRHIYTSIASRHQATGSMN